jgi:hypothetical protein
MKRSNDRAGFAMLLVLAFLVLFFSLMTMGYSQLSSLLRTEKYRVQKTEFDQGVATALAGALHLLETGYPTSTPYVYGVTLTTDAGTQQYAVTMTLQDDNSWYVHVEPAAFEAELPAAPAAFTATTPPPSS